MALVRETAMDDWLSLREIRLAALQDAPDAFASTHAREETFDEAAWRARIARGGSFLAYVPESALPRRSGWSAVMKKNQAPSA